MNRYLLMDRLKSFLLDLIFPRRAVCMGCGSKLGCYRDDLCEDFREKLAKGWVGVRHPDARLQLLPVFDGYSLCVCTKDAARVALREL